MSKYSDNHFLIILFALLLLIAGLQAANAETNWTDNWESIQKASEQIQTIQAEFTQEKQLKILQKPIVSKGAFVFSAPGCLRWEYLQPVRSILVVTEQKAQRFLERDGNLIEDESGKVEAVRVVVDQIIYWLKGNFDESASFTPSLQLEEQATITLTPKEPGMAGFIQKIEITLSKTPGVMESIRIIEPGDNSTLLRFTNVRLNLALPKEVFEIRP